MRFFLIQDIACGNLIPEKQREMAMKSQSAYAVRYAWGLRKKVENKNTFKSRRLEYICVSVPCSQCAHTSPHRYIYAQYVDRRTMTCMHCIFLGPSSHIHDHTPQLIDNNILRYATTSICVVFVQPRAALPFNGVFSSRHSHCPSPFSIPYRSLNDF